MKLWTWLLGEADEPEAFGSFLLDFEGRYREVAHYVDKRLQAELPQRWRWLVSFIDHAAVGDRSRWISVGMLVVFEPNSALIDDESTHGDESGGYFIFRGKG